MKRELTKHKVVSVQDISRDCFCCGIDNASGLHAHFFNLDDNSVYATFVPSEHLQSYPDRLHGGVVSTLMDELMSRTIQAKVPRLLSVTIKLETKYRAPVPLSKPVHAIAWIEKDRTRVYDARAQVVLEDGTVAIEAFGQFAKLHPEDVEAARELAPNHQIFYPDDVEVPKFVII